MCGEGRCGRGCGRGGKGRFQDKANFGCEERATLREGRVESEWWDRAGNEDKKGGGRTGTEVEARGSESGILGVWLSWCIV